MASLSGIVRWVLAVRPPLLNLPPLGGGRSDGTSGVGGRIPSRLGPSKPVQGIAVHLWGIDVAAVLVRWSDRSVLVTVGGCVGLALYSANTADWPSSGVGGGKATPSEPVEPVQGIVVLHLGV